MGSAYLLEVHNGEVQKPCSSEQVCSPILCTILIAKDVCMFCKLAFFSSPPHPSLQSNLIDVISALVLSTYPHLVDAISDAVLIFAFVLLCSLLVLIFVSLCNTILLMLYLILCSSLYQSAKQSSCCSITRPRNICHFFSSTAFF